MAEEILQDKINGYFQKLKKDAEDGSYFLNADEQFVKDLVRGLLTNESRYGYQSCPCRLAAGEIEKDRDIICPCDYRDADLNDFGTCYCGLYVSEDILKGRAKLITVPERRNLNKEMANKNKIISDEKHNGFSGGYYSKIINIPVWRCRVCGYLCARQSPPLICPICKAKKDRFEQFF